jgi:hypothetical protein
LAAAAAAERRWQQQVVVIDDDERCDTGLATKRHVSWHDEQRECGAANKKMKGAVIDLT